MELKELRKPETDINWSNHKLTITKNENMLVDSQNWQRPEIMTNTII